ncbi:GNAT family N-acetyltransferase [Gorillibacterium sp. CAU 1737]|uniref:GNAT family N-acetyltransferase n=1 Tax=Gorillibacterium sp. CAU 1737 TaxID=3140362 RepID=UPI003260AD7D
MERAPEFDLVLVEPQEAYKEAFLRMVEEYRAAGEVECFNRYKEAPTDFDGYLQKLKEQRKHWEGWVPTHSYWLQDAGRIAGVTRIRPVLTLDEARLYAGHIGYDIAPLSRKKGYGSVLLGLALEKARLLQRDKVLLTCDVGNTGSQKIIEKHGGILESVVVMPETNKELRRYWITLAM